MKIFYRGVRLTPDEMTSRVQVDVLHQIQPNTQSLMHHPLVHFPHHSPDGFNWGYQGSGPADLALAILLDHFKETPTPEQMRMGQPLAWRLHQFFKREFVAGWGNSWQISSDEIDEWLASDKINQHVKEHAKLWEELEGYMGHDLSAPHDPERYGPEPTGDIRMASSDPAFKWHDAPTAPLPEETDNAGE